MSSRFALTIAAVFLGGAAADAFADGKLVPPREYRGSLEETSQEAILIFEEGTDEEASQQEMILKISAQGEALSRFAWIVPFPAPPEIERDDPALFQELFQYVESRRAHHDVKPAATASKDAVKAEDSGVEVISRKTVGVYDTAVVRETAPGVLNGWLKAEGYRELEGADDVLEFYRRKGYAYACIKVSEAALTSAGPSDLHPLRFTFSSGGRDGIYFPMKLTGLQNEPFHVNLYVFHRFWINDRLSPFGYAHRGFQLQYRDWDSSQCVPNAGKDYTDPAADPFLKHHAHQIPTVVKRLKELHPGNRYYLTNIQARNLRPAEVRQWKDDLWLFPYYTNRSQIPYDAQPGKPAAEGYEGIAADAAVGSFSVNSPRTWSWGIGAGGLVIGLGAGLWFGRRNACSRA